MTDFRPGEVPVGSLCVIEDPDPAVASSGYIPSQGGILRCGLHHRNSLQGGTMAAATATGSVVAASAYDDFPFREAIQAPVAVNRIGEVVVEQPLLQAAPEVAWPPPSGAVSTATTATQSPPRVTFAMDQQTGNAAEN